MVFFDIATANGRTILEARPGCISFDQFKEKLIELFPQAKEAGGEWFIQFYDLDGILQTIRANDDFQKRISSMSIESNCRLYVCLKLN